VLLQIEFNFFPLIKLSYMKTLLQFFTFCAFFLSCLTAISQSQASLDFDGVDDKVRVAGAVDLISGSQEVSMACWASLNNAAPGFPDFDGIMGFRNEFSADFYLLQLSATEIEARFRNSNSEEFTIVHNGDFQIGTWQHFALTYDGSYMRLFMNGAQVDSLPANGTLANAGTDLMVGFIDFQAFTFGMTGKIDEVGVWNRKISSEEINCMITSKISPASQGLQIYLDFNEGIVDGDNTTLTSITNLAGTTPASIADMALTGTTSNFGAGVNNYEPVNSTFCGTSFSFGSQIVEAPGFYYEAFPIEGGCDSLVALNVSDNSPDVSVVQNENFLIANATGASYQWINCLNNQVVAGAVNQSFIPSVNGQYAVIVTQNACSDTSDCFDFTTASINFNLISPANIFPNPANRDFQVSFPLWMESAELSLIDLTGKIVYSKIISGINASISRNEAISDGVYFLEIRSLGQIYIGKIAFN